MGQRCSTEREPQAEETDAPVKKTVRTENKENIVKVDNNEIEIGHEEEQSIKEINANVPIKPIKRKKEKHLFDDAGSYLNISMDTESSSKTVIQWRKPATEVYFTGSFCDWKDKIQLTKSGEIFWAALELADGDHEIKFIVDNVWCYSEDMQTTNDGFGGMNNIVHVQRKSDES